MEVIVGSWAFTPIARAARPAASVALKSILFDIKMNVWSKRVDIAKRAWRASV